jgi:2-hydroxy-3-oxopropionate reductase
MTEIAFLGLGLMGRPMALNLIKGGHRLRVWNRSADKAATLVAAGAVSKNTAADAAEGADVVFTMLSDGRAVHQVLFDDGVAETLNPGALLIDTSSIGPAEAREHAKRLADRGIGALDAPVSGGPTGAEAASLAIMVGGSEAHWQKGEPLLKLLGRPVRIGPVGTGQLAKLANQVIVALAIGAVSEALFLSHEGGADPAAVRRALTGGFADSLILKIHGERMLQRKFVPGGAAAMHLKDMDNVLAEAKALGIRLPLAETVRKLFADLVQHRGRRVDHSGLLLELERLNPGHRLGKDPDQLPPPEEKAKA